MTQEEIQENYKQLCAELGHLTLSKRGIDARLQEIEAQIAKLNEQAGALQKEAAEKAKNAASPKDEQTKETEREQSQAV